MAANRSRDYNPPIVRALVAPRSDTARLLRALLLAALFSVLLFVSLPFRQERIISTWTIAQAQERPAETATLRPEADASMQDVQAQPEEAGAGVASVDAGMQPAQSQPTTIAGPSTPALDALESYNQASILQDSDPQQRVRFYRRDMPGGGALAYFVVSLDEQVHVEVVSADGATPGSDATGDTIWTDGQRHLAPVAEIANAPYAAREGMDLLGAMAFGFHGDARTSDEGTVVVNGTILRVNPGRATLCITKDRRARVGLFDRNALGECEQAAGAGPVILWKGKIANPDVAAETDTFVPFNPLNEDFVQIDWRRKIYSGLYPKTAVGVGTRPGGDYLVMVVSFGVSGLDLAGELKAMGCTEALGGDDDTSTQATWRGAPVRDGAVQEVPDALSVYVRR